jgi:hypothetical protein
LQLCRASRNHPGAQTGGPFRYGIEPPGWGAYIKPSAASTIAAAEGTKLPLFKLRRDRGREIALFALDALAERKTPHADDLDGAAQILRRLLDDR